MEGELDLPMLPDKARQEPFPPKIRHSLVSIGTLCDAICTVTANIKDVPVIYKDKIILLGWENN